jgi:hypothetical protein
MRYHGDYGSVGLLTARETSQDSFGTTAEMGEAAWGCTCFVAFGDGTAPVFGRNFDWFDRACLLLFTDPPGGYASVSMVDIRYCGYDANPDLSSIESRRRLLRAPFMPFDGLNDHGVAIGMMAVPSAQVPFDPSKHTLSDLGIIRLVLDHAASTREAISLMEGYNIRMSEVPLHYLVADRGGESAVIEFVNNKMEVLPNPDRYQVSTNFIIHNTLPNTSGHCWRYDLATSSLGNAGGRVSMTDARTILQSVSQDHTMWSSVYALKTGEVQIVTGRNFDSVFETKLIH